MKREVCLSIIIHVCVEIMQALLWFQFPKWAWQLFIITVSWFSTKWTHSMFNEHWSAFAPLHRLLKFNVFSLFSPQWIMATQSFVNEMQTVHVSGTAQQAQHQPAQTTIIATQPVSAHSIQPTSHTIQSNQQFLQLASK